MTANGAGFTAAVAGVPLACDGAGRVAAGTTRLIDGQERVHYEGYWIKTYPVPEDTLQAKKHLIEALTRRLFNHTEHGLNIPGHRMAEARRAYEAETDPGRKRVKGAMYAGALFNRATNIFTRLVDLQSTGVEISANNDLMRECGRCLQEALSLCRLVLHRSGEEGIDELWGEPFRAFCIPLEAFYASRYLKMAQAMRDIDRIARRWLPRSPCPCFPESNPSSATSLAPPARRSRPCGPIRTSSTSGLNWSPRANGSPASRRCCPPAASTSSASLRSARSSFATAAL